MSDKASQPAAHQPVDPVHTDSAGNIHQEGVPVHATDDEPASLPTSDRHHSETAPHPAGGNADAPKHEHSVPPK
jgi:hypothetical protein